MVAGGGRCGPPGGSRRGRPWWPHIRAAPMAAAGECFFVPTNPSPRWTPLRPSPLPRGRVNGLRAHPVRCTGLSNRPRLAINGNWVTVDNTSRTPPRLNLADNNDALTPRLACTCFFRFHTILRRYVRNVVRVCACQELCASGIDFNRLMNDINDANCANGSIHEWIFQTCTFWCLKMVKFHSTFLEHLDNKKKVTYHKP